MIIKVDYLGRKFIGGGIDEEGNRSLRFEEYFKLDDARNLPTFLAFLSPPGKVIHRFPCFRIKSTQVERITQPTPDGSVTITISAQCETRKDIQELDTNDEPVTENTPPWMWRLENYRVNSVTQNENIVSYWGAGNIGQPTNGYRIPQFKDVQYPYTNTAGTPMEGETTRAITQISFDYNVQYIDRNVTWMFPQKINASPVRIAAMNFPERTVLIQDITLNYIIERNPDTSIRWEYFKVSVTLLADPKTYNRDFLNLGTNVYSHGGVVRLWTWGAGRYTGIRDAYASSGYTDGEEITEPVFLAPDGTSASALVEHNKQIPIYLTGSVYELVDLQLLGLPEEV